MNELSDSEILNSVMAIVLGVAFVICLSWLAVTIITALKQRANTRTRAEIIDRLIDKFGTTPEFMSFLQSDTGMNLLEGHAVAPPALSMKILSAMQKGLILTFLGAGLIIIGRIFGDSLGTDLYIWLSVGGTTAAMAGIGFLISSAISYRLAKMWGLLGTGIRR